MKRLWSGAVALFLSGAWLTIVGFIYLSGAAAVQPRQGGYHARPGSRHRQP